MTGTTSEVDQSALSEENDVSAGGHGESVDLGFDVDCLDGVLLQPSDIDLDVKVTDAAMSHDQPPAEWTLDSGIAHLETMASSCMTSKCLPTMMSLFPVVVTKTLARGAAVLHGGDFVSGHGGLEGVDGVDLSDEDSSAVRGERLGALRMISTAQYVAGSDVHPSRRHRIQRRRQLYRQA